MVDDSKPQTPDTPPRREPLSAFQRELAMDEGDLPEGVRVDEHGGFVPDPARQLPDLPPEAEQADPRTAAMIERLLAGKGGNGDAAGAALQVAQRHSTTVSTGATPLSTRAKSGTITPSGAAESKHEGGPGRSNQN